MVRPNDLKYSFQSGEEWNGTILFTVTSQDSDFVHFLMDKIYLELDKSLFDMEGIIVENNIFRETRKILIKKKSFKENLPEE